MIKRILMAAVLLPVSLILVFMENRYPFLIFVSIALTAALNEMYVMFDKKNMKNFRMVGLMFGAVIYAMLILDFKMWLYFYAVALFIMGLFALLLITRDVESFPKIIYTIAPVFFISTLGAFGILLRQLENGSWWLFVLFALTMSYDAGAYFIGSAMGRHKLIPELSPGKTVEGAAGGMIINAAVITALYFFVLPEVLSDIPDMLMHLIILSVIMSVVGQGGDISVSVIKRFTGVKNASNILPGHGGVLDRIDSLLFNAPVLYFYIKSFLAV
ncbi:MAG: phosphatidate cytidylyltransferase [Candidatus Goldiibacteriota bacterium]